MSEPEKDWPLGLDVGLSDHLWSYDDLAAPDQQPSIDPTAGLVSWTFIKDALKRRRRLWYLTAVLGLLIGSAIFVEFPTASKATTTVLLKNGPSEVQGEQIQTDTALAQSDALAQLVVKQLNLPESAGALLASYTVQSATDQTLTFTVSAASPAEAVRRASALATDFLQVRSNFALAQQQEQTANLDQQVARAQQHVQSLNSQISQLSGQSGPRSELDNLRAQLNSATIAVNTVEEYRAATEATTETGTKAMIQDSIVIDAASAEKTSHIKRPAEYVGGGLFGGLFGGMAVVIVSALISDRLRRRDDVATAMGMPVRLSVGAVDKGRLPFTGRGKNAQANAERTVDYLYGVVPDSSEAATLAVIAVDNAETVAGIFAELVKAFAGQGKQVIAADLSDGARAVRALGVTGPGIAPIRMERGNVLAVVPSEDEIAPAGPLGRAMVGARQMKDSAALLNAWRSADLMLTFAELDPGVGGDHLTTWATDAVALVTAGRSSVVRLRAVGEMIRLAGVRTASAVLIGADKTDDSLGIGVINDHPVHANEG